MADESALSRIARASLGALQRDFESLAPKFLQLRHLYIEYNEPSELPLPALVGDRTIPPHGGGPTDSDQAVFLNGEWVSLRVLGGKGPRVWESWYEGDGKSEFHALAERAGPQLEPLRIGVPPPSEVVATLNRNPNVLRNLPMLPGRIHRWVKVLHWLAWSGEVMSVRRVGTWNGMNVPYDDWDESKYGPRPTSFCSIIDNVFLRSVSALDWMIARLEPLRRDLGSSTQSNASPPKRKRMGRPPDTDHVEDRRITQAWDTGRYKSYEDLGNAMGVDRQIIKLAIDRERKRASGKSRNGKTRQEP